MIYLELSNVKMWSIKTNTEIEILKKNLLATCMIYEGISRSNWSRYLHINRYSSPSRILLNEFIELEVPVLAIYLLCLHKHNDIFRVFLGTKSGILSDYFNINAIAKTSALEFIIKTSNWFNYARIPLLWCLCI